MHVVLALATKSVTIRTPAGVVLIALLLSANRYDTGNRDEYSDSLAAFLRDCELDFPVHPFFEAATNADLAFWLEATDGLSGAQEQQLMDDARKHFRTLASLHEWVRKNWH